MPGRYLSASVLAANFLMGSPVVADGRADSIEPTLDFGRLIDPIEFSEHPLPRRTEIPDFGSQGDYVTDELHSPFSSANEYCEDRGQSAIGSRADFTNRIPGASGFFDYHCKLFADAADRIRAVPVGTRVPLRQEVLAANIFSHLLLEAQSIQYEIDNRSPPERRVARLEEIMRTRLLGETAAPVPTIALSVKPPANTPDKRPLNVPLSAADIPGTRHMRQTTVTAHISGEVETALFQAWGAAVSVVDPVSCDASRCEVAVAGGKAEVTYEFQQPSSPGRELEIWADLSMDAAVFHDGRWIESTPVKSSFLFAQCDKTYARRVSALSDVSEARQRLIDGTKPVIELPGKRLADGPVYAAFPSADWSAGMHPGDIDDLAPDARTAELVGYLEEVVTRRAADSYFRETAKAQGLSDAFFAIGEIQSSLSCDPEIFDPLMSRVDAQLQEVEQRLAVWEARNQIAETGARTWELRVKNGLALFDATRFTPTRDTAAPTTPLDFAFDVGARNREFLAKAGVSGLVEHMLKQNFNARIVEGVTGPPAIYSAIAETVRVLGAISDLEDLVDLRAEINEAVGWLELEAYFDIMVDRYARLKQDLRDIRSRVLQTRRDACICYRQ